MRAVVVVVRFVPAVLEAVVEDESRGHCVGDGWVGWFYVTDDRQLTLVKMCRVT